MRILIASNYAEPHIGGLEAVVRRQCESLAAAGHDVTLICARHDRSVPSEEQRGRIRVVRVPAINTTDRRYGVPFAVISPRTALRVLRLAAEHDVVHVHDLLYPLSHATIVAARLLRRPLYLTQHVGLVVHPVRLVEVVQSLMYRTFGRLGYQTARRVVAYNANVRSHALSLRCHEEKLLALRNGIDTDFFSPSGPDDRAALRRQYGFAPDAKIALFVGRLVPKKGFDVVASAGAAAGVETVIVGNGQVPDHLADLPGVHFYGPADAAELRDLYRLSDMFVFPAVGEIFTLVMQEAMASGLPVITTNDPAYFDAGLDPTRIKFVDVDVDAVALAMRDLASDDLLRRAMGEYSRNLALHQFSWDSNYEIELGMYETARPSEPAQLSA